MHAPTSEVSLNLKRRKYRLRTSVSLPIGLPCGAYGPCCDNDDSNDNDDDNRFDLRVSPWWLCG